MCKRHWVYIESFYRPTSRKTATSVKRNALAGSNIYTWRVLPRVVLHDHFDGKNWKWRIQQNDCRLPPSLYDLSFPKNKVNFEFLYTPGCLSLTFSPCALYHPPEIYSPCLQDLFTLTKIYIHKSLVLPSYSTLGTNTQPQNLLFSSSKFNWRWDWWFLTFEGCNMFRADGFIVGGAIWLKKQVKRWGIDGPLR